MFNHEYRTSEEISRVAAAEYALRTAIDERRAQTRHVRQERRRIRPTRAPVTEIA